MSGIIEQGNSTTGSPFSLPTAGSPTPTGANQTVAQRAKPHIHLDGVNHFGIPDPTMASLQSQVQQILGMKEALIFKANVIRMAHIIRMRIIDVLRF